ncbi:hypothetical protein XELAEV_18005779mg [Xenopus laevis]|uniref:GIY-YIG domain-containing protein n=1 Tax=Xenopus laevis TaxID=8355 RepID=A0A974DZX0_XENLA|nr:hypothetical protein XELAEV_18005779mg [Xenopus laevis]
MMKIPIFSKKSFSHHSAQPLKCYVKVIRQREGFDTELFSKHTDGNQLLHYTSYHPVHTRDSIPISQFSRVERSGTVATILRKHWGILKSSTLTQSYIGARTQGMFPCLSCTQWCCVHKGTTFEHPITGRKYLLRGFYTCRSKFAVYVLICPCGLLYIGETTLQIKTRISQHRSTIRKGNVRLPVSRHFVEKGHLDTDLKFMVLECVPTPRRGGDRELML